MSPASPSTHRAAAHWIRWRRASSSNELTGSASPEAGSVSPIVPRGGRSTSARRSAAAASRAVLPPRRAPPRRVAPTGCCSLAWQGRGRGGGEVVVPRGGRGSSHPTLLAKSAAARWGRGRSVREWREGAAPPG